MNETLQKFYRPVSAGEIDIAVMARIEAAVADDIMRLDVVNLYRFFRYCTLNNKASIDASLILVRDHNVGTVEKLAFKVATGKLTLSVLECLDEDDCDLVMGRLQDLCAPSFSDRKPAPSTSLSSGHASAGTGGTGGTTSGAGSGSQMPEGTAVKARKEPLALAALQSLDLAAAPFEPVTRMGVSQRSSYSYHPLVNVTIPEPPGLFTWDFNVMDVAGRPELVNTIGRLVQALDVAEGLGVDQNLLGNFLADVCHKYRDNPFHNLQVRPLARPGNAGSSPAGPYIQAHQPPFTTCRCARWPAWKRQSFPPCTVRARPGTPTPNPPPPNPPAARDVRHTLRVHADSRHQRPRDE